MYGRDFKVAFMSRRNKLTVLAELRRKGLLQENRSGSGSRSIVSELVVV